MLKRLLTLTIFFLLSCISARALAHPHNWISLGSQFLLNTDNQLIEIKQTWEFDTFYSVITSADIMNTYGDMETGLKPTADAMADNLKPYHYFSKLTINGKDVALPAASEANLTASGKDMDTVLTLELTFRFATPVVLTNQDVIWSVYDPTFYIAMTHPSIEAVTIVGGTSIECGQELKIPSPSDEMIDYAASLDQTQRDTEGLGDLFAEEVVIQCI